MSTSTSGDTDSENATDSTASEKLTASEPHADRSPSGRSPKDRSPKDGLRASEPTLTDLQDEATRETNPATKPSSGLMSKPKAWVRIIALVAVLFTGWHVFASFLWIAPYSQNAREVVPGQMLTNYMIPMFGQSWSVFAPEPINGDYHFNVRAVIETGAGEEEVTGWVSATDVELSMIQYNLMPPRAGIQSSEVASSYKGAFDGMQDVDRVVLEGDFAVDEWEVGLRAALESQENKTGSTDDARTAKIDEILAEEHRSTAYATQVARAIWGDSVREVQYRVSRQNIIPFAQRHNPDAVRPDPTVVLPGWRGLIVEEGQSDKNFADVFSGQFERITK